MRKVVALVPIMLSACATAPAETPVRGAIPGKICNAAGTDRFIGQPGNVETGTEIMRATNAAVLRWAPPGYMMTMDFSASRVTVRLGPDYKVTAINCG
ncbi:MAG: I78 family peptidase inhibitor [Pseudomonadota bacterium]